LNLFYFLKRVLLGYEDKPSDLQISMWSRQFLVSEP
jgi:hypothetical protein